MIVVYTGRKLKVLKSKRDYLVVRNDKGIYGQHGHFNRLYSAREFIGIIESGELPRCEYYIECAKRVLTQEEFNSLRVRRTKGSKGYNNRSRR